jgi:type II secretory pathway component PulM
MDFWHNRSAREKIILLIGSVAVIIIVFYALLMSPLNALIAKEKDLYTNNINDLAWLQHATKRIVAARNAGIKLTGSDVTNNTPALIAIQNGITAGGLQSYFSQSAESDGQVTLQFKDCPFDSLLGVVASLSQQNIKVIHLTSSSGSKLGTADGTIIFRAAS